MEEQMSVLSSKHSVSVNQWIVGMLRKPKSNNPHHVLLVVEGRNSFGHAILRRYDLYIDEKRGKDPVSNQPYSQISIRPDMFCAHQDSKASLDTLINAEEYYVKAWEITADKARELHANIQETAKNPPVYLMSGDMSSLSCGKNSQKIEGHSCYTWARSELKKIGLDVPKSTLDNIIAVPDFVIKPESAPEKGTGCRIM